MFLHSAWISTKVSIVSVASAKDCCVVFESHKPSPTVLLNKVCMDRAGAVMSAVQGLRSVHKASAHLTC